MPQLYLVTLSIIAPPLRSTAIDVCDYVYDVFCVSKKN
jgi:hypothetical protein